MTEAYKVFGGHIMKKKIVTMMLVISMLTLSACGNSDTNTAETTDTVVTTAETTEEIESESNEESSVEQEEVETGQTILTNGGDTILLSALEHREEGASSIVYYTSDISPEGLMAVYEALGVTLTGENIAVKLSTGEPPASNYLDPSLIENLVSTVNGTIVECNTAYGGQRSSTAMHYQVAEDHGFTEIADFVVMDEDGSVTIPVEGGSQLKENYVGAHFPEYDGFLVLSHFKGHAMAGMGGALKNISIGIASQEGKCLIHTAGASHDSPWGGEQDPFLESMAEAGKGVSDAKNGNMIYVNVLNRLSVDCDCAGNPAEPDMHDIGIMISTDPVAIDQASVDLVYASPDNNTSLIERMESRNAYHVLEHGEEIGLGNRTYELISID